MKIGKPDLSKVEKFKEDPVKYPDAMSEPVPDTPWAAQPEERN